MYLYKNHKLPPQAMTCFVEIDEVWCEEKKLFVHSKIVLQTTTKTVRPCTAVTRLAKMLQLKTNVDKESYLKTESCHEWY
jgi:hypothetical protein